MKFRVDTLSRIFLKKIGNCLKELRGMNYTI